MQVPDLALDELGPHDDGDFAQAGRKHEVWPDIKRQLSDTANTKGEELELAVGRQEGDDALVLKLADPYTAMERVVVDKRRAIEGEGQVRHATQATCESNRKIRDV
jgi:hypothetical protein